MFESRRDKALALLAVLGLGAWAFRYLRRLNDPLDYLSLSVAYEPQLSIARFEGLRQYDALTYDDAMASMREFSRQYQASFLAETDPCANGCPTTSRASAGCWPASRRPTPGWPWRCATSPSATPASPSCTAPASWQTPA